MLSVYIPQGASLQRITAGYPLGLTVIVLVAVLPILFFKWKKRL